MQSRGNVKSAAYLVSMSAAIEVGLITAISTIAGVSISGCVAFLVSRNQGRVQITTAKNDRLEQRAIERRQIRRDAYLQYFNQLGSTEQALDKAWMSVPPSTPEEFRTLTQSLTDSISDLSKASNLVLLESSGKVGSFALQLNHQLQLELAELVKSAPIGLQNRRPICLEKRETFTELYTKRGTLKVKWVFEARKSLDDVFGPSKKPPKPTNRSDEKLSS